MSDDQHHEHLIKELTEQLGPVFTHSPQGVYLYLDDSHKTCSKKFADMLGYASPEEWAANEYPVGDVVEEDRENVIQAYVDASENFTAATLPATWTRKDGTKLKTDVIMVPIPYRNALFVLHFVSERN